MRRARLPFFAGAIVALCVAGLAGGYSGYAGPQGAASGTPTSASFNGTTLTLGSVSDGQFLKRNGSLIVGAAGGGGGSLPLGWYGDGSDGAATLDGVATVSWADLSGSTYTMSRPVNLTDLTVNAGITLNPDGWRLVGNGTLTVAGTIARDGLAILSDTGLEVGAGGNKGAAGFGAGGSAPDAPSSNLDSWCATGGNGGDGSGGPGGAGGATDSYVPLEALHRFPAVLTGVISHIDSPLNGPYSWARFGGGGGGGTGGGDGAANGGAGGVGGGVLPIAFRTISVTGAGAIHANGQAGTAGSAVDRGGGGGGAGGLVLIFCDSYTGSAPTAAGGAAGAGGGGAGLDGTAGSAGVVVTVLNQ
jgi:hypothetical protein